MNEQPILGTANAAPLFLRLVTPMLRAGRVSQLRTKPSVFILSTGRTGTVYLADLLNQPAGVLSVHEPKPSRVLNAWTTAYLEGKISNRYMASALFSKRRRSLANDTSQLYVESNNFVAGFADALDDVFAGASVIHIVRDPRDFVTSLTNRGDNTGIRKLFNLLVPYWAYVPAGTSKRQLSPYTRPAHRWMAINQYLSDFGRRHPDRYHFFKFEDVFDKADPGKLRPVLRAAGLTDQQIDQLDFAAKAHQTGAKLSLLDKPTSSQNQSKAQAMAKWPDWTEANQQAVAAICGPLMRQYGYGGEPGWPNQTS